MALQIMFKGLESTESIKDHVEKRIEKFGKYVTYPMDVHVILSLEKAYQCAEITCHAEHRQLVANSKSKDMYESIDKAAHKMEAQLKREREKRKGHKSARLAARPSSLRLAQDVNADIPHREKKIPENSKT